MGKKGVGLYNRLPYYCLWPLELPLSKEACHRRPEQSQAADSCPAAHTGWKVVLGGGEEEDGWDGKVLQFNWGKRSGRGEVRADRADAQRGLHLFSVSSFRCVFN